MKMSSNNHFIQTQTCESILQVKVHSLTSPLLKEIACKRYSDTKYFLSFYALKKIISKIIKKKTKQKTNTYIHSWKLFLCSSPTSNIMDKIRENATKIQNVRKNCTVHFFYFLVTLDILLKFSYKPNKLL